MADSGTATRRDHGLKPGGNLGDEPALVGRTDVLGKLRTALEAGRAIALVGPAGVGKTSVARHSAAAAGRRLYRGAAVDYLQARPFLPLVRIVGHPLGRGDAAAVAEQVRQVVGDAVLLLDDLQWSDPDTVEALPALAATGPLIVTIRPGGDAALRAVKQIQPIGQVIDLEPLSHDDSIELARRLLPYDPAGRAVDLAAASGGNPLALEALTFAHTRAVTEHADTLRAVIEACPHVARVTLARLGLRDPEVHAETTGVSELVDRRLAVIGATGSVTVAAEIFAELAMASLDDVERTGLHLRRAEAIQDPGEAAIHWAAAGVPAQAFATALEAAANATTDASRAQFLTVAAENSPTDKLWSITRLAVLAWLDIGELEATKPLVARLATHEPPTVSDAIDRELMRTRFALEECQSREVLEIADATIETFGADINAEQQVSLLVARAAAKGELYDIPGAIADARAATEIGDEHGISVTKAGVILAAINMVIGDDRWRTDLRAVFRRAKRDREYGTAFEAGRLSALARFFDGDIDGGLAACSDLLELAAQQNNHSWDRAARGIRAANLSLSELASAEVVDELRQLVDDPAIGGHRHPVAVLLAIAESDLGNFARADELVQSAVEHAQRWRSKDLEGLLWARCEIAWNAGRLDECVVAAEDLLSRSIPLDFGTPAAAVTIRWVEWERNGECSRAPGPLVIYSVQRGFLDESLALELLCTPGREREAADTFLRAADLHDRYLRRNAVRCRWAAGEALRRAGDTEPAAWLLSDAAETCERHGLVPLGRRVEASLRLLGATHPATLAAGRANPGRANGGLTAREQEVLTLVRAGLSTAEIAAQLHVRPSTVDSHIRKSMKRLGASNRREAALLATQPS